MSSTVSKADNSSTVSASMSIAARSGEDHLPEISFSDPAPTNEEADQIERFLSENPDVTSRELQALFSGDNPPTIDKDLKSLFVYNLPAESIADDVRVSVPDTDSTKTLNGNSYASFGDEGTTVTVNSYGNIMQITRSLGYGNSGLFCVDDSSVDGPTSPQSRLEQLMQLSKRRKSGTRLEIMNGLNDMRQKPNMEFIFNRWPRFTWQPTVQLKDSVTAKAEQPKHPSLSLQYFCHKGTVFQRYTINHDPESSSAIQHSPLCIRRSFLIRSLDYVNESTFNKADQYGEDYVYKAGPQSRSLIMIHGMTESHAKEIGIDPQEFQRKDGPKGVALIITAFVNGKAQHLDRRPTTVHIDLSNETKKEIENSTTVDITIAYRLQTLASNQSWRRSFIPASALSSLGNAFSEKSGNRYQDIRWSSHAYMNFITGRNLEHILSVCSMSLPKMTPCTDEKGEMDSTSLAFTCGDMSGHRIATTAGFFAFNFLLQMLYYICDSSKKARDYLPNPKTCSCDEDSWFWQCGVCEKLEIYLRELQMRILTTLEAHLTWTAKVEDAGNPDVAHFWITGKKITDCQGRFAPPSLTEVPFNIIKSHGLHQYYKTNLDVVEDLSEDQKTHLQILKGISEHEVLENRLGHSIRSWLQRLYERDKRCRYAFSRVQEDGRKKYHLADHIWICRAIKCVEELGLDKYLDLEGEIEYLEYPQVAEKNSKGPQEREKLDGLTKLHREKSKNEAQDDSGNQQEIGKGHRSSELQRVVLKRFTTRNPRTQQWMLATSRTPSETRFLFHAKDTALFYAMDHGFFDREKETNNRRTNWTNKIAAWKETIEVQAEHEETQTLEWEKPLWYALALIISARRRRINKTPADELLHTTAEILFGLSSSSGIFPGLLNEKREPIPFEDQIECDKYWHATFEIPYALWMYGRAHLEASVGEEKLSVFRGLGGVKSQGKDGSQLRQPMMKKMEFANFSSLIDKSRLVEVSDDWLREVPSSLNFDAPTAFDNILFYREMRVFEDWDFGHTINSCLDSQNVPLPPKSIYENKGRVFDVPKNCSTGNDGQATPDLKGSLQTNQEIIEILKPTRTTQKAKKRLIWLPRADKETALACYLASPRVERDNLSVFFDRHASYEKYFSDGTSASLNEWTTELHLSYFRRGDWDPTKREVAERNRSIIPDLSFILVDPQRTSGSLRKNTNGTKIVRSAMSFRFVGDFFDRYWTCHFLECDPAKLQSEDEYEESRDSSSFQSEAKYGRPRGPQSDQSEGEEKGVKTLESRLSYLGSDLVQETKSPLGMKQPWQQRKVLELLLFEYILGEIFSSTEQLLKWVRDVIREKDRVTDFAGIEMASILEVPFGVRATKPLNPLGDALQAGVQSFLGNGSEGYFSIVERWRFFEQVLQAMEEDLSKNLEVISSWNSREKDREPERPRWTRNDEMTYRQVINKLQVINQKRVRDLEGLRVSIRAFRDSLVGRLDTMRSDLEYRGSENINLFTYVTVVFLPLGFATGIFSMSNSPDRTTLVNMIQLALIAMAITLFALSNAKTTGKTVVQPIILVFRFINNRFLDPLLKPFCVVGNVLLYFGMAFEFLAVAVFYVFLGLPLKRLLNRSGRFLFQGWESKSARLRKRYRSIVDFNNQVMSKKKAWDPSKAAQDFYDRFNQGMESRRGFMKLRKAQEYEGDAESGKSGVS